MQVSWSLPKHDSSSKSLACEAMKGLTILSSNTSPCDIPGAVPGSLKRVYPDKRTTVREKA